ncbi:MAG: MFS transporter [Faecalibacterium sp.]
MSKQPLEDKARGIHRAKTWEIAFYACNNLSTNLYMILMASISYYLIGIVGLASVVAGSIGTVMRIWDGVTDPFVGMVVDRTNSKFGKNRPFIVIGQLILFSMTFAMFRILPNVSTGMRFPLYIVFYMLYIIGYTAQCVVTKSAQSCLTNDPAQRPVFAMFDSVYLVLVFSFWYPIFLSGTLIPNYTLNSAQHADKIAALIAQSPNLSNVLVDNNGVQILSGFYNPDMWVYFQLLMGTLSAILAVLAIIGLWRKDRIEYFGTGVEQKVTFKDYVDVLAHNRGIQMLIVAASSDKLSMNCKSNAAVTAVVFGVLFGNYAFSGSNSAITTVPILVLTLLAFNRIACKLGQKKCLVYGTCGSLACAFGTMLIMLICANKGTFLLPTFSLTKFSTYANLFKPSSWSIWGLLWVILLVGAGVFNNMASNIVIPMTADCTDYEVYRSGRYVPGLMGTLFSFIDKLISSLAPTIVALAYSLVGFSTALPTDVSPFSTGLLWATIFCYLGMPAIGWACNLIAMKFYPLTKEKMEEIQEEVARIKAEAAAAKS